MRGGRARAGIDVAVQIPCATGFRGSEMQLRNLDHPVTESELQRIENDLMRVD